METDGAGDDGVIKTGAEDAAAVKEESDGAVDERLEVKVEDLDEVLKELMLYADMSSRDCQPFLTRHAYVHRYVRGQGRLGERVCGKEEAVIQRGERRRRC